MATTRARRYVAACLVVLVLLASGCEVRLGPPPQDVGDQPHATTERYWGQVSRKGRSPKFSVHSSRVRSRPTARQANSTALSVDRSQS